MVSNKWITQFANFTIALSVECGADKGVTQNFGDDCSMVIEEFQ